MRWGESKSFVVVAGTLLLVGCGGGSNGSEAAPDAAHADAADEAGASLDGGIVEIPDAGDDAEIPDAGDDAATHPVKAAVVIAPTAGGGTGRSTSFQMSLSIGGPQPHGTGSSANLKLSLGVPHTP